MRDSQLCLIAMGNSSTPSFTLTQSYTNCPRKKIYILTENLFTVCSSYYCRWAYLTPYTFTKINSMDPFSYAVLFTYLNFLNHDMFLHSILIFVEFLYYLLSTHTSISSMIILLFFFFLLSFKIVSLFFRSLTLSLSLSHSHLLFVWLFILTIAIRFNGLETSFGN